MVTQKSARNKINFFKFFTYNYRESSNNRSNNVSPVGNSATFFVGIARTNRIIFTNRKGDGLRNIKHVLVKLKLIYASSWLHSASDINQYTFIYYKYYVIDIVSINRFNCSYGYRIIVPWFFFSPSVFFSIIYERVTIELRIQ